MTEIPIQPDALDRLVGLECSGSALAADMRMFSFGPLRPRPGLQPVGSYALHLQCPWRLIGSAAIITGSSDLREYYIPGEAHEGWTSEQGDSLQTKALDAALAHSPVVRSVFLNATIGDIRLAFDDLVLEVLPSGTIGEHWRFFVPGSGGPHVVFREYE